VPLHALRPERNMAGERDFERRLEIVEKGIREIEQVGDPGLRATAQQLIQAVLELHGRSLERLLEIVDGSGEAAPGIIDRLGRDPLVSSLLLLHSLHPLTLEERVDRAIQSVRPTFGGFADVIAVRVQGTDVHVRMRGGPEQRAVIERAIVDAAPDAGSIEIEGESEAVVGFVSMASLRGGEHAGVSAHRR